MSQARNIGLVQAHVIRLEQLLHLPPGHHITSASWNELLQEVQFAIEGPSMPLVQPGEHIPFVKPMLKCTTSTGVLYVTWP